MIKDITLVIGGCRSGKSSYALNRANSLADDKKIFMATSVPTDQEMENRVICHQQERGDGWLTVEEPVNLPNKIMAFAQDSHVILVDCLTLWTSNLMFREYDQADILAKTQEMSNAMKKAPCPVILVTNEVGAGIVPENALARKFRDMAGFVNQTVARDADRVVWMVAGIPNTIKP